MWGKVSHVVNHAVVCHLTRCLTLRSSTRIDKQRFLAVRSEAEGRGFEPHAVQHNRFLRPFLAPARLTLREPRPGDAQTSPDRGSATYGGSIRASFRIGKDEALFLTRGRFVVYRMQGSGSGGRNHIRVTLGIVSLQSEIGGRALYDGC